MWKDHAHDFEVSPTGLYLVPCNLHNTLNAGVSPPCLGSLKLNASVACQTGLSVRFTAALVAAFHAEQRLRLHRQALTGHVDAQRCITMAL